MNKKESESGRLLIVDDERESLNPVCELLQNCGYMVEGHTSCEDALAALEEESYDLLLTDLVMPDMDGITLLTKALQVDPCLMGIIITGRASIEIAVDAMKSGAFDFISKPLDLKILKRSVSRAMEVRRLREEEKKYRLIFENAIGGIYQTTKEGRCITANRAFARILGYDSPEELIALVSDISRLYVKPDRRQEFMRIIEKNNIITGFESEVYRKNGGRIWISEHARAIYNTLGNLHYYEGCVEDITVRKGAQEELRISREQLRSLSAYLESAREEERMYIAREIHDELGQMLTALKMELFCLGVKIPGDKEALLEKTKAMSDMIDAAIKTVQRISTALRPTLLDDLGLAAAIEWQVEEFQKRTGIPCELVSDTDELFIDRNVSIAFYRILQEALTNIVRHADANKVNVTFINRQWNKLMLEVSDNGKGITEAQISSTRAYGLTGIRERVYLLGGQVGITGNEGKGTTLKVEIPLSKEIS
jgi:two-component system, NarL family, sensor histidine kinase UhpB